MKFRCDAHEFSKICSVIKDSATARSTNPYTECLRIRSDGTGELEIAGYNLVTSVTARISAEIEEEGVFVVRSKNLCDVLSRLSADSVSIAVRDGIVCNVDSGRNHYTMTGLKPENFPEVDSFEPTFTIDLEQGKLREMIRGVVGFAAQEDARTAHSGVKFDLEAGRLQLVALDGYRLAVRRDFAGYNGEAMSFIVPSKSLGSLIRLLADDEDIVRVEMSASRISFKAGIYTLRSDLLKGMFMNYERSLPKETKVTARVGTQEILDAVTDASVFIDTADKGPVKISIEGSLMTITSETATGGAVIEMEISTVGEDMTIGFNSRYLKDALNAVDTDEVMIALAGPLSPAVITPPTGDSFLYLVLPVRLNG